MPQKLGECETCVCSALPRVTTLALLALEVDKEHHVVCLHLYEHCAMYQVFSLYKEILSLVLF
jgi:hypothetical protein